MLIASQNLKLMNEAERRVAATHAGMPAFAGTGTADETCSTCKWFHANRTRVDGMCRMPVPGAKRKGIPAYPGSTPACRHHDRRSAS